jgi:hypothetical protein
MKLNRVIHLALVLILTSLLATAAGAAGFEKGDKVWTKQYETALLAEPKPLAAVEATVGFAEKLKIKEVHGTWLRVKGDEAEGWVFQGNVAIEKPEIAPGAGLTTVEASQTDTVAAARPLSPAAQGYAERHGAFDAQSDIDWIDAQAALITGDELVAWMSANQLGEYQP